MNEIYKYILIIIIGIFGLILILKVPNNFKSEKHAECSVISTEEMDNSFITTNKINCPEGKYRCFLTIKGVSCLKIGENL